MSTDLIQDLKVEIVKCNTKLDTLIFRSDAIDSLLHGNGEKEGLRIDVDRLKTAYSNLKSFVWLLLTTMVGMVGTLVYQMFFKD